MDYDKLHASYKVNSVQDRYLNLGMITPILQSWKGKTNLEVLGYSVEGRPIYSCEIGQGKTKILMWSQMHGNESTSTKGLLDFMNMLQSDSAVVNAILNDYSFCIVPMLNPDGAEVYTRFNANEVDLNRDFQNLSQPESQLLMDCYYTFKPHYCYNLHDQRTIFGAGTAGNPATISFLVPSYNEAKEFDEARMKSVAVIVKMVKTLEVLISGQIGRFDDGFNINCSGDTFQNLKTPTILIEAGHFPNDYRREQTRKYIFIALLSGLKSQNENVVVDAFLSDYLSIPQNIQNYYDFIYKNVRINYENSNFITNFAVQFREQLISNKIVFNGFVAKVGNLEPFFGHDVTDALQSLYKDDNDNIPKEGELANFSLGNNAKFVNGLLKK
jgi:hypothetical protein